MNSLKIKRDVFVRLLIESLKVERSVLFVYLKKIIFLRWSVIVKFVTLTLSCSADIAKHSVNDYWVAVYAI